jgi:hypothetical protein
MSSVRVVNSSQEFAPGAFYMDELVVDKLSGPGIAPIITGNLDGDGTASIGGYLNVGTSTLRDLPGNICMNLFGGQCQVVNNLTAEDNLYVGLDTHTTNLYASSLVQAGGNLRFGNSLLYTDTSNITYSYNYSNFHSPWQNVNLPTLNISGHNQPVAVQRLSVFVNDVSFNLPNGTNQIYSLGTAKINQMDLLFQDASNTIITASPGIANQFVELYVNMLVNASNNTNLDVEISGLNSSFLEIIDSRSISKAGIYNVNFSNHIVPPDEFTPGDEYVFKVNNFGNQSVDILKMTTTIKSYFV